MCDSPPSTPTTMIYWVSPKKLLDTLQYSTPAMENLNLILCFSRFCPEGRKKQSQSVKWVWLTIPGTLQTAIWIMFNSKTYDWSVDVQAVFRILLRSQGPKPEKKTRSVWSIGESSPKPHVPLVKKARASLKLSTYCAISSKSSSQVPSSRCCPADVPISPAKVDNKTKHNSWGYHEIHIYIYIYVFNQLDISMKNGALPWNQRRVIMDTWVYGLSENRGSIPPEPWWFTFRIKWKQAMCEILWREPKYCPPKAVNI